MAKERKTLFELCTNDPVQLHAITFKSKLKAILSLALAERRLNQTEVAKLLETTQPRVSDLLNGKLDKFSIDFLLDSLFRLGYALDTVYDPTNLQQPMSMVLKQDGHSFVPQPLYTARDVVHTLVERGEELGLKFTRVKLQKLVYAAHGQMLALHDRPLIDEPFSVWRHGPLVESLHHELKAYGKENVRAVDNWIKGWGRVPESDTDAMTILDAVLHQMGRATAQELVDWSKVAEGPWHQIYFADDKAATTIENSDIQQHFRKYALVRS